MFYDNVSVQCLIELSCLLTTVCSLTSIWQSRWSGYDGRGVVDHLRGVDGRE